MEIRLDGKRALVTGASSGIGEAIALALADAGAKVGINYIGKKSAAESVANLISKEKSQGFPVQADVSDPAAVEAMFQQLDSELGGIDILVNNAGIDGPRQFVWESDIPSWEKVLQINLFGAFYCARQALKRMVPQKSGVIINITSVHEIIAWSGYSAYAASKAGLGMLSKTLAQEAAPYGIRVLSIAPGAIKTPINRNVWADPEGLKDLLLKIPLNRVGEPGEVANMVVVLASDAASYVTGRTYYVDGGMTDFPDFAHGG